MARLLFSELRNFFFFCATCVVSSSSFPFFLFASHLAFHNLREEMIEINLCASKIVSANSAFVSFSVSPGANTVLLFYVLRCFRWWHWFSCCCEWQQSDPNWTKTRSKQLNFSGQCACMDCFVIESGVMLVKNWTSCLLFAEKIKSSWCWQQLAGVDSLHLLKWSFWKITAWSQQHLKKKCCILVWGMLHIALPSISLFEFQVFSAIMTTANNKSTAAVTGEVAPCRWTSHLASCAHCTWLNLPAEEGRCTGLHCFGVFSKVPAMDFCKVSCPIWQVWHMSSVHELAHACTRSAHACVPLSTVNDTWMSVIRCLCFVVPDCNDNQVFTRVSC